MSKLRKALNNRHNIREAMCKGKNDKEVHCNIFSNGSRNKQRTKQLKRFSMLTNGSTLNKRFNISFTWEIMTSTNEDRGIEKAR